MPPSTTNEKPITHKPTLAEQVDALDPKVVSKYLENKANDIVAENNTNTDNPAVVKKLMDANYMREAAEAVSRLNSEKSPEV